MFKKKKADEIKTENNIQAIATYKCGLCNKIFTLNKNCSTLRNCLHFTPLYETHYCSDGKIGIAILLGIEQTQ